MIETLSPAAPYEPRVIFSASAPAGEHVDGDAHTSNPSLSYPNAVVTVSAPASTVSAIARKLGPPQRLVGAWT